MPDELEDDRLTSRVLSGSPRMAVDEHEALFDAIYDEVRPAEASDPDNPADPADPADPAEQTESTTARSQWPRVLALAATVLLVAVPVSIWVLQSDDPRPEFQARGGTSSFRPACVNGTGEVPCSPGGSLNFVVAPAGEHDHFAAFGRSEDGTVYWYYPTSPDASSLQLTADGRDKPLPTNVKLSQKLSGGTLSLYGVFSAEPLRRDSIRSMFDDQGEPAPPEGVEVVRREIEIQ